jgi:hypothetical protein
VHQKDSIMLRKSHLDAPRSFLSPVNTNESFNHGINRPNIPQSKGMTYKNFT